MPISCQCPSCGKRLKARDSAAGKKVKCPDCGATIAIPSPKRKAAPSEPDELDLQSLDIEKGIEGPAEIGQKPCPMCGEMINESASKCRYCGEDLVRAAKKAARRTAQGASSTDDEMQVSDWIFCILCSGIACIVSIIYLIMGKKKATMMLAVSFGMVIFWNVVTFVAQLILATMAHQR